MLNLHGESCEWVRLPHSPPVPELGWGAGAAKRDGLENHREESLREFESRPHRMNENANQQPEPKEGALKTKEELLFHWVSPARPFKKRNREFFTTIAALGFLIGLILFFIDGVLPVAVVLALVFLVYVLASVEPEQVEHRITNKGVVFAGKRYAWDELGRFWFTQRFGNDLLIVEIFKLPGRLEIVVAPQDMLEIRKHLEPRLEFEKVAPDFVDKAAGWISKKVPLD